MANDLAQNIDIYFEEVVEAFDATNVTAKNVSQYKPNVDSLSKGGQTFYRPWQVQTQSVDGRDISGSYQDLTEMTVPTTLTDAHLRNVPLQLTGSELGNSYTRSNLVKTAKVQLSNKLDTLVADAVASEGTLVVTNSGPINTYDEAAVADALMLEQQVTKGARKMLFNPRMAVNMAGNLASRGTMAGAPMDAYTRSMLPPVAGFDTFRTDYGKSILGSAGTGYLVDGAAQDYTPVAKDANGLPVDNSTSVLTVKTGTGAAVGDSFTITDTYAVGHINKQSTGQLKTYRILGINTLDWTVAPAIIPADGTDQAQKDYGNINTTPADGAAITILNTVTKPASIFFEESAVELVHAEYPTEAFAATGKKVRTSTTDSGIQIVLLCDSNIDTLVASYRMFIWANVKILNNEAAGILLEEQT